MTLTRRVPFLALLLVLASAGAALAEGTREKAPGSSQAGGTDSTGAACPVDVPGTAFPAGDSRCPPCVRTIVSTGHRGEVLALEYDEGRGLVFSAGEDGTVRVWDAVHGVLSHRLQVTHMQAAMLAVSPVSAMRIAVLETDGARNWAVSVWDWQAEKRVFRVELSQAPLFLRWSGGGRLLAWGESRWDSLRIVEAASGTPVPFPRDGLGIVSFAEIGASEKTLMTYQPAGRIAYWDLATGSLVKELSTVAYLTAVRISRDRRFLVGSTGSEAVLVDLLSGGVRARAAVVNVLSADISASGDGIALASASAPAAGLSLWSIGAETAAVRAPSVALPAAVIVRYGAGGLFAALRGGGIVAVTEAGVTAPLGRDELAVVTGLDVLGSRAALAADSRIWVFSSGLLAGRAGEPLVEAFSLPNPFSAACGLSFVSADILLLWKKGGEPAAPLLLDIPARTLRTGAPVAPGSLLDCEILPRGSLREGQVLSIDQAGTVVIGDPLSGKVLWQSLLPGLFTAASLGKGDLAGGRNAAAASSGSLLRINVDTGETVGIPTRGLFTYDLAHDMTSGALYSIGVAADGSTSLLRHSGRALETETAIDRVDWEDLFASLALDPTTGLLFSSLGSARIGVWDSASLALQRFPDPGRVPRSLRARDGLLFALNRDSTVSVWNQRSGERLAEISVFADGEWAFLLPDGRYSCSEGGASRLSVTVGGQPVPRPADCRVR
jgi:hypothetical protein